MSGLSFDIVTWSDQAGNYYGKVLFVPWFLVDGESGGNETSAIGKTLAHVKNQIAKSLKLRCEQAPADSLDDYLENQGEVQQGSVRVSIRPVREYDGQRFPSDERWTITTPIFYRDQSDETLLVECPMEDISFSCLKTDSFRRIAMDSLTQYYQNQSTIEVFLKAFPPVSPRWTLDAITLTYRRPTQVQEEYESKPDLLEQVATPLKRTSIRRDFIPPWGRNSALEQLIFEIGTMSKGLILVGPTGCGKSTLLAAAVTHLEKMYRQQNTKENRDRGCRFCESRFWRTNASRLTAGTKWFGEWEKRIEDVIAQLYEFNGVLCLEDIVSLVGGAESTENSLAAFLTEYLQAGEVKIICEATLEQLERIRLLVPDFVEQFQLFEVNEMNADESREILSQMGIEYKKGHPGFEIEPEVPGAICELCRRFYRYESFPGKASRFWQKAVQKRQKQKVAKLTLWDVYSDFIDQSGLPDWLFRDCVNLTYESVWQTLAERVIGQPEACQACAHAVVRFKTALNNSDKPIASFLFCGPTGVGKTQLAKTLSEYLFGAHSIEADKGTQKQAGTAQEQAGRLRLQDTRPKERMFRLDMSEYQNYYSAQRLIETPSGRPSPLIEFVRRHSFCVVLFDEIEKAAPEAFDILLNLLDEGRLTDRLGRTTSFQNTIVIMTSNLGGVSRPDFGFGRVDSETRAQQNQERYFQAAKDYFRPEFVNRIDRLIAFRSLDKASSERIVELELAQLSHREGVSERKLVLKPTAALISHLTEIGFDPVYGARPLQRAIEAEVVVQLSRFLTQRPDVSNCVLTLDSSGPRL